MSDYQAIFDAVRSRISGGNFGDVVERVARDMFDISFAKDAVAREFMIAADAQRLAAEASMAPHVLLKPTLRPDGDQWMMLLGENLHVGISGFGDTPAKAAEEFDKAWRSALTPAASVALHESIKERSI